VASLRTSISAAVVLLALTGVAGCGSSAPTSAPAPSATPTATPTSTAADADFVRHMLVHHERALQLGQAAADRGSDPRVRAFGGRILTEQTPERAHLADWATALGVAPGSDAGEQHMTDASGAAGYVTDDAYRRLLAEPGPAFDRDVLLLSAGSEQGAVEMSQAELAAGTYAPARALATSIVGAQNGEIPELRQLAADLPG
jgi:uncharacterized protein (DUF305 family)